MAAVVVVLAVFVLQRVLLSRLVLRLRSLLVAAAAEAPLEVIPFLAVLRQLVAARAAIILLMAQLVAPAAVGVALVTA
jgi:hypothetical protein